MDQAKIKKIVARTAGIVTLPLLIDVATEPYAYDRGPIRSWFHGAGKLIPVLIFAWAVSESPSESGNQPVRRPSSSSTRGAARLYGL